MKIQVGKKYRMRNYPTPYKYVYIFGQNKDFNKDDFDGDSYVGTIVEESKLILNRTIYSDGLIWGENGSWDNAEVHGEFFDSNDLVIEVEE